MLNNNYILLVSMKRHTKRIKHPTIMSVTYKGWGWEKRIRVSDASLSDFFFNNVDFGGM